ncbi:MAG TPA: metallopeptidase family protein [Dermatophilaceae bacterium]|nr:metallopeptidase family protein [Dermatophilaceae bacterium]
MAHPSIHLSAAEFDAAVEEAMTRIPVEFQRELRRVPVFVEAEPADGEPELLGLYEGVPLTERDEWHAGALPDQITLYQGPLERMCSSREELLAEIAITVVHEMAHHFGIDDDRLHELGWG